MNPIDLTKLWAIHRAMIAAGIKYGLGAKAKSLTTSPHNISRIDCSGHFRYVLANATDQKLIAPDGSWIQRAYLEKNGVKQVPYSEVEQPSSSGRLFAAFMTAGVNGVGKVGHVWLINGGRTLESYGGHGVGSRDWNVGSLKNKVHKCFELPTTKSAPPKPEKPQADLIIVTKDKKGALDYQRIKSAVLNDGGFTAEKDELLSAMTGGSGRVDVRTFLKGLGATPYDEGNHLDDPKEPRMYLFVDVSK